MLPPSRILTTCADSSRRWHGDNNRISSRCEHLKYSNKFYTIPKNFKLDFSCISIDDNDLPIITFKKHYNLTVADKIMKVEEMLNTGDYQRLYTISKFYEK